MKKPGLLEKLIVAYVVFVIVLMGLAVFLVYVSSRLGNVTADIYYLDQNKKEITDKLINDIISLEETSKQYLLLQQESYKTLIGQREESITRAWEYLCLKGVCDDQDEITAVRRGMQVWGKYLERFHAQLADPPKDAASLDMIFRENSKDTDSMVRSARIVYNGVIESLDQKIIFLKNLGEQIRLFTWWALGIAATIGLIIPLLIYKSITNDLKTVRTGIKHIAQGDFSYRIPLYSKDELGVLAESFNVMSLRLKELDNMKSEFIAIVSHELKTPLTSMKEAANLLMEGLSGELNDKQKRLITIMQQGMDRLLQMISELLEISKLESGMIDLQMDEYDFNEVVSGFVSEIHAYAEKKEVSIDVSYLDEIVTAHIDRNKIVRVLTNLTQNAIKYSHEGSEVRIGISHKNNRLIVAIEDHGKGIPEEDIPLIFEKFYQSKATRGHSGIGLGLAISRSRVDAHGGEIYAKSEVGKGSVFTFSIPVNPPGTSGRMHAKSVQS